MEHKDGWCTEEEFLKRGRIIGDNKLIIRTRVSEGLKIFHTCHPKETTPTSLTLAFFFYKTHPPTLTRLLCKGDNSGISKAQTLQWLVHSSCFLSAFKMQAVKLISAFKPILVFEFQFILWIQVLHTACL
jgi:hypothetical protein